MGWRKYEAKSDSIYARGEYTFALNFLDSAIHSCISCNDSILGYLHIKAGKLSQYANDYSSAIEHYYAGERLALNSRHKNLIFWATVSVAEYHRWNYKMDAGKDKLKELENLLNDPEISTENKAYYLDRLAAISHQTGVSIDSLLDIASRALELYSGDKNSSEYAQTLNQYTFFWNGTEREKRKNWRQAMDIFRKNGREKDALQVGINIVRSLVATDSTDLALKRTLLTLDRISVFPDYLEEQHAYTLFLIHILTVQKKYKEALEATHRVNQIAERLDELKFNKNVNRLISENELKIKNAKIQAEQREKLIISEKLKAEKNFTRALIIGFSLSAILIVVISVMFIRIRKLYRKQSQLLHDKDFLIKEVHHRVKNNLQNLSSLLNIQLDKLQGKNEELLKEVIRRIDTISLTHHLLYGQDNVEKVEMRLFFKKLVELIQSNYRNFNQQVELVSDIDQLNINYDKAVSLGMILSELFTNSFKYSGSTSFLKIHFELKSINEDKLLFNYYDVSENTSIDIIENIEDEIQEQSFGLTIIKIFKVGLKATDLSTPFPFQQKFEFPHKS
ncbi:sensor histidine kinase [Luteibaculum oceani]|nr:sensor histidine kinase [Luteibaculum oceani]